MKTCPILFAFLLFLAGCATTNAAKTIDKKDRSGTLCSLKVESSICRQEAAADQCGAKGYEAVDKMGMPISSMDENTTYRCKK